MDKYKFLKLISDNKAYHVKDPHLDNPFSQFLPELDRQELIKATLIYPSNGKPGITVYWITTEGIDCIDVRK